MSIRIMKAVRTTDNKLKRNRDRLDETGIALVTALMITLIVFLLIGSVWYATMRATRMSSPVYIDACAASDGAIQATKDAINQASVNEPVSSVFPATFASCIQSNIISMNVPCTGQLILPSTMGDFTATVTLTPIFQKGPALSSKRFPRNWGQRTSSTFYRIVAFVDGPNNTRCENAVVYRNLQ